MLDRVPATVDLVSVTLEVELKFVSMTAPVVLASVLVEMIVVFKLVALCETLVDSKVTVVIGSVVAFQRAVDFKVVGMGIMLEDGTVTAGVDSTV